MTQDVVNTYSELWNIPLSYAKEGIRDAQFPIEGYDELTVEEVSERLSGLSAEGMREVRDYELVRPLRHPMSPVPMQDRELPTIGVLRSSSIPSHSGSQHRDFDKAQRSSR